MDELFYRGREPAVAAAFHPAGRARSLARTGDEGRLCRHAHPRVHSRRAAILQRLLGRHRRAIAGDRRGRDLRSAVHDPIPCRAVGYHLRRRRLSGPDLATAAQDVFPDDPAAQAWLTQAMTAINELLEIASVAWPRRDDVYPAVPGELSLLGHGGPLRARIPQRSDISPVRGRLPAGPDGHHRLRSTHAPRRRRSCWRRLAPGSEPGADVPADQPRRSLVNCVPPPCLSPTGPIAYLQEMLNLSQLSTCVDLAAAPVTPVTRRRRRWARCGQRRGPVGNLLASCANLETPLPLIDIVNECLDIGAAATAAGGTVYDTSRTSWPGSRFATTTMREDRAIATTR